MNKIKDEVKNQIKDKEISYNLKFITFILVLVAFIIISIFYFYNKSEVKKILPNINSEVTHNSSVNKNNAKNNIEEQHKNNITFDQSQDFIIYYYQMHLKANQGKDFSNELLALNKYSPKSKTIKDILNSLVEVAKENEKDSYFYNIFTSLIKSLYLENRNSDNILSYYLNIYFGHLLFIRPIGNRAINLGGFDMNIILAQNKLLDNQLEEALEYIEKLYSKLEDFNAFKQKLKIRIYIINSLLKIDSLLMIEGKEK